jgi:predicted phage terminase large subunit-like protein
VTNSEKGSNASLVLTRSQLQQLLLRVDTLKPAELQDLYAQLDAYEQAARIAAAKLHLLDFCRFMDPDFIVGAHHILLAESLEALAFGDVTRLAISMPPRMGKSRLCAQLFPAWYLGHFPTHHIIGASNTSGLAEDNIGRVIRDLIMSDLYRDLFPDTVIRADMSGAGRWMTSKGGAAYFVGTGGALAGRGAHLFICDDPHAETDLKGNVEANFDNAFLWYQSGPRQRLMANGKILLIHTRWSKRDMIGRVLDMAAKNDGGDSWKYLELPAILPNDESLWPERFTIEALRATRASMAPWLWSAQYQQQPVNAESAVVKREYFKRWVDKEPECEFILGSLDTAMEATTRSDFNALTVWGVFKLPKDRDRDEAPYQIILLDVLKKRMEYPELKQTAIEWYNDWEMNVLTIERKNSGASLIQDLISTGILAHSFRPGTKDKISRLNMVIDIIASGLVWIPDGYLWAEEFMDEICGFPGEPNDDLVDSMIMALMRFREGGFITLPSDWTVDVHGDYDDDEPPAQPHYWSV